MRIVRILLLLLFLLPLQRVFAQEVLDTTASPAAVQEIEYPLPYPGILPDNNLYVLKTIRDRVVSFLIADPLKKAEFDLLQADKRLAAGMALVTRKKPALAVSTISKGENYADQAIGAIDEATKQGAKGTDMLRTMNTALKKHHLIVSSLAETKGPEREGFVAILRHIEQLQKTVNTKISHR